MVLPPSALTRLFPLCLAPNLTPPHLSPHLVTPCFQSCILPTEILICDSSDYVDGEHTVSLVLVRAMAVPFGLQATSPSPPVSPLSTHGTLAIAAPVKNHEQARH